jgi:hypothetical protein
VCPFNPGQLPCIADFRLVLGENGVAFATDLKSVVAFNITGMTPLWSYTSASSMDLVAVTAGNGLVAKATDQNGFDTVLRFDATGNLTPLMSISLLKQVNYSWQGRWNDISNNAVSGAVLPTFPISYISDWAQPASSSSATSLAVTHHTFGLFWCGSAFAAQGYVPNSPCIQGGGDDIQWGYYPQLSGIAGLHNFAADHPYWVNIVLTEAFNSFQKAYAKYGVQVTLASQTDQQPDQEFTAYILGDYPFPGAGKFFSDSSSAVYYFALMEGAQEALGQPANPTTGAGWIDFSPSYPPPDTNAFVNYLRAVGKAIGNSAAHEMGHHLERIKNIQSNNNLGFPFMDCGIGSPGTPNRPVALACENSDNFVYAFYDADGLPQDPNNPHSTGGMFFYGVPGGQLGIPVQAPIHWGPSDVCWLQNYVTPGSCKQ